MQRYVVGRLVQLVVILLLGSLAVFFMLRLFPGDPAAVLAGPDATREQVVAKRHALGLDEPIIQQYARWLLHSAHGDLGESYFSGQSIGSLLKLAMPVTLQLSLLTVCVALGLGLALGIAAATHPRSAFEHGLLFFTALGLGVPDFLVAVLLSFLFALKLRWLPASGFVNIVHDPLGGLKSSLLPVAALAFPLTAVYARFTRQSFSEVLAADYVRTARAKGLRERRIILVHALRNSLVPLLTVFGLSVARLLGGVVIIESVFALPGMGRLAVSSIQQRDYGLFQAIVLLFMVTVILINLVVDLSYAVADPRVRV